MKQTVKKIFAWISSALLFLPAMVFAQTSAVGQGLTGIGGLRDLFGIGGLSQEPDLPHLIYDVIKLMLLFAGAIAVLFIIIGGYYYITASGNEEQSEKGKKTLINAIIGIVIIILAYTIITVIENTITGGLGV